MRTLGMTVACALFAALWFALPAGAGIAYFSGAPGETGIAFFDKAWTAGDPLADPPIPAYTTSVLDYPDSVDPDVTGFNTLDPAHGAIISLWEDVDGVPTVMSNVTKNVRAGFTLDDGVTLATIDNGNEYVVEASWDVPEEGMYLDYEGNNQAKRMMVGIQFDPETKALLGEGGGIGNNPGFCAFGLEYRPGDSAWGIGSHNRSLWGNWELINPAPQRFAIRLEKTMATAAGATWFGWSYPAGVGLLTCYFSVDGGPWTVANSVVGRFSGWPLTSTGGAMDKGPDCLAYSVRGTDAARNLKIMYYGEGVPDVNAWEGGLDFDGDGLDNAFEISNGLDPFMTPGEEGASVPVAGIVGLALFCTGVAAVGVRRMRARR